MEKMEKPIIRVFNVRHPDLASPEIWELFHQARSGNLSAQRRFARIVLLPMAFFYCTKRENWRRCKMLLETPTHQTLHYALKCKVDDCFEKWFQRPSIKQLQRKNLSSVVHFFVQTLIRKEWRALIGIRKDFYYPKKVNPDQEKAVQLYLGDGKYDIAELDFDKDFVESGLDPKILSKLTQRDRGLCRDYCKAALKYIKVTGKVLSQVDYCKSVGIQPPALNRAIRHYREGRGFYYYLCPNRKWGVGGSSEMRPKTVWHGGSIQPCWSHPSNKLVVKAAGHPRPSFRVIIFRRAQKKYLHPTHPRLKWGWTFRKMYVRMRDPEVRLVYSIDKKGARPAHATAGKNCYGCNKPSVALYGGSSYKRTWKLFRANGREPNARPYHLTGDTDDPWEGRAIMLHNSIKVFYGPGYRCEDIQNKRVVSFKSNI